MWRPGVAKTQDFRNALDKVVMLPQGLGNIDLGPILGSSYRVGDSPSDWRVDPVGSLVPASFGHDVCLMSGSLSYVSLFVTAW